MRQELFTSLFPSESLGCGLASGFVSSCSRLVLFIMDYDQVHTF